jgi:cell division septum initiation protein DivIVA
MRELLNKIEARRRVVRETAEQLREQITRLTEQLTAAEDTLKRLEITRDTLSELAAEDGIQPPEPLPPGYREILAAIEKTEDGLRAKDVCQALGLGTEPKHTEGTRAKLKRLVTRGILTEPEPGLFTLTKLTPGTAEANSS